MTYLELLQRALAEEIEATRLYLACMAPVSYTHLIGISSATSTRKSS